MKVALYTRVSTEDQAREGYSLDVQRNFLLQYAKNFNYEVFSSIPNAQVYEDDGYTGGNMDRPALQRLLDDAKHKRFDLIIVYKQDRLSRKLKDLLNILEEFDNLGIAYKSATEPFDTTSSAGKMAIQMLGSYAEFERNRLTERVFPGMVEGVKKGHWQGARFVPYGYTHNKETKKLQIQPDEAKIVKEVYRLYRSGKSTFQIAKHFYDMGIPSRGGGRFYQKFIRDILTNKTYLGTLIWNKYKYSTKEKTKFGAGKWYKAEKNNPSDVIVTLNAHEAIISQKEYDEAQKILAMKRTNQVVRFKNSIYHLSGVLRCNVCGNNYCGKMVMTNRARNLKKPWYHCLSKFSRLVPCNNMGVTAESINDQVWSILEIISENLHVLEELEDLIKVQATEPTECYVEQLKEKEKQKSVNIEKQRLLFEVHSEDRINIEVYKEKADCLRVEEKRLKSDIKELQLKILEKQNSINVRKDTEDFLRRLNATHEGTDETDFTIKTFMRIIFRGVYIHNQEIVKVEINQPWKLCYEKGLECKMHMKNPQEFKKMAKESLSSIWRPTAVR